MKLKFFFFFLCCVSISIAQEESSVSEEISIAKLIDGTLLIPEKTNKPPLAIIIQGSGPTDRDGNQPSLKNNSLKYLAEGLYHKNIASFRYDKRIVKLMQEESFKESEVNFTDFIEDAKAVVTFFKNDLRFSEIIIIGHSQGSLVGMITAQEMEVDKYISIAGAGQEIDDVVIDQLRSQAPSLVESARKSFDNLRVQGFAQNYDPSLATIFRPSLQHFIYTWMQYNPKTEIAKLNKPILILNGDADIQVQVSEAEKLKEANPKAKLIIIKNMNHVFKEIKGDLIENQESYNKEDLPIMPKLTKIISSFILN